MGPIDLGVRLSEHWWSGEFQCKCGCGFGLGVGDVDERLVDGLEELRRMAGQSLYVVRVVEDGSRFHRAGSGCRCVKHNRRIGGEKNSFHLRGMAADVWGLPVARLASLAEAVPEFRKGGIGVYETRGFVHVDVRGTRARW